MPGLSWLLGGITRKTSKVVGSQGKVQCNVVGGKVGGTSHTAATHKQEQRFSPCRPFMGQNGTEQSIEGATTITYEVRILPLYYGTIIPYYVVESCERHSMTNPICIEYN